MAQRGGKRPGAGRKAGAPNKATAKQRDAVKASGLTPLDYMLSILRDETMTTESRFEAAKAAAPYVHPKLANIDHDHKSSDGSMTPKPTTIRIVAADDGSNDKAAG
jgi:hypothetical protein